MKKYLIIVGVVLVVIALIAAYNQKLNNDAANQRTTKGNPYTTTNDIALFIPTTTQPTTAQLTADTDTFDVGGLVLSQDEAVADYNYMWQVLEDNYAFFGVAQRKYGVDKDTVKQKYLDEIMKYGSINWDSFGQIISQCLSEFHGCGKLNYIGFPSTYATVISVDDNVSFNIIDSKTAYMKIKLMNKSCIELNYKQISNFYSQIKDCENLIIDITGSTGGDINYWIDNIVQPNINTEFDYNQYFFVKPGNENRNYLSATCGLSLSRLAVSSEIIQEMKSVSTDDIKMFDRLYKNAIDVSPTGEKQFNGNIYLLVDKSVTSASETFAAFCKNTGFATIVGTMWGGGGSDGGIAPNEVMLPNSGLTFEYSTMYVLNADGSCNEEYGTPPDYICEDGETPLNACLRVIAEK
ncbi:MAG: S41 family peptidase [Oscillospiraceae bacterium]|nr:S41 family peptidase [Oscillospiraceae bacterium]